MREFTYQPSKVSSGPQGGLAILMVEKKGKKLALYNRLMAQKEINDGKAACEGGMHRAKYRQSVRKVVIKFIRTLITLVRMINGFECDVKKGRNHTKSGSRTPKSAT